MKEVFINVERCTGCKSCEIACAVEHSVSKDLIGALFEKPAPKKMVHVEKAMLFSYPSRCMHCADAACIAACPSGAMHRDAETGGVEVSEDRCMGCWMCSMVCPFGAISTDRQRKVAVKCDFCKRRLKQGRPPACVEACPTKALAFGESGEFEKAKRMTTALSIASALAGSKEEKSAASPLEMLRKMGGG